LREWIEAALRDGGDRWTYESVIAQIEAGEAHLWLFERSALVTQFIDEDAGRTLFFWLAGGDLAEILSHEDGITGKALVGRRGWEKALGWKVVGVALAENIE